MGHALRTVRYLASWLGAGREVEAHDVTLHRNGTELEATWVHPTGARGPLGGWVVLHGLTRTGRQHAQLQRFAGALAATGSGVLIPEVPEWQELHLAPEATLPTVRAALDWMQGEPLLAGGRRGLLGFSFGAPQAVAASGDPSVRDELDGVAAFGGYCDLERTIRFQLTGEHEWDGTLHHHRPDPYGRWIVAGNHLTDLPEHAGKQDAAQALLELARKAGDVGVPSWDPSLRPTKEALRETVAPGNREIFDYLAAPDGTDPSGPRAEALAAALTRAAAAHNPAMEVTGRLEAVRGPVHLIHGRADHLIPFTEAHRLARALPDAALARLTVTALFGHSSQDPFPWGRGAQEVTAFLRAMTRMLSVV